MDGEAQIISMPRYLKKILFSISAISVLSFFIFLGINYNRSNLAFLSGIITAWVTINPLEVNVSAPAEVEIGKVFKVEVKVINKGEEKIEDARAEIFLPPELILLKKDSVQEIGVIPGKKEKKISWSVRGEKVGNYFISVKASGELRGELISAESSTIKVSVVEKISPGRFDFLREFFEKWFGF